MDAGLAAIIGALVGGVVGAGAQVWDRLRTSRREYNARRLTLLEDALNNADRTNRAIKALWLEMTHQRDEQELNASEDRLAAVRDAELTSLNLLRIHFGEGSPAASRFFAVTKAAGEAVKAALDARSASTADARDAAFKAGQEAHQKLENETTRFVATIRNESGLD